MKLSSAYGFFLLIACLMLSIFQSGCDLLSQSSGDFRELIIQTDKETYSKEGQELITASIRNESARSVFISMPGPVSLEKKIDGKWENIGTWYLTAAIVPRLVKIAPGEVFSAIPRLDSGNLIIEKTGSYKLNFHLYSSKFVMDGSVDGSEYVLPLKYRISNTFYISD